MRRRTFLAFAVGVGAELSPLGAIAGPRKSKSDAYSDIYSNTY